MVTLTATPSPGYVFSGWSGDASGTANPITVTMTAAKNITANFTIKQFALTVAATNGTVTKSSNQSTYDSGAVVTLTAIPSAGYVFSGWSGDASGTSNPVAVIMNSAKNVTANFAIKQFTISISAANGTVAKSPGQASYDSGTVVTLTATPSAGYVFSGWSGDAIGTSNPISVTVNSAKNVTANFAIKQFAVSITAANGSVTKVPDQATYDSGSVVTLTASPSADYRFTGWSGDVSGSATPATVTMTGPKSVVAGFALLPPDVPALVSPANNAANIGLDTTLAWSTAARASLYRVQLSRSQSFLDTVFDDSAVFGLTRAVGPLTNGVTYYWRVEAKNSGGMSAWSAPWSFATLPPVPPQPLLVAPADTSRLHADSAVFSWHKTPATDRYALEIAGDSLFSKTILLDSSVTDTTRTLKALANNAAYWWRVRGRNISGWGAYSAVFRFTVELPVTAVLPKSFSCAMSGMANSRLSIRYALPVAARVTIRLFGAQGRLLAILHDGEQGAGYYCIPLNRIAAASGMCFLDFKAGKFEVKRKMPLFW